MATLASSGGYAHLYTGLKKKSGGRPNLREIDGVTVYTKDKLIENWGVVDKGREAVSRLSQLISQQPNNAFKTIQLFKKYSYDVIQYFFIFQDLVDACSEEQDRMLNGMADRSGKRWTDVEDNMLIDLASMDNETMTTIALKLGRTPSAVQTRLSYLVGIQRLSTQVAGRFVGWLNGEQVEGEIDGTVSKV